MNSLQGSLVTNKGLPLSERCSVTISIMLSVKQVPSSLCWSLKLAEIDCTSSGTNLDQPFKMGPGGWGGEVHMQDSLVGMSREVRALTWRSAGDEGCGRAAGKCKHCVLW